MLACATQILLLRAGLQLFDQGLLEEIKIQSGHLAFQLILTLGNKIFEVRPNCSY
jgi:hypothetical protein